jgi:AcrR family transcriptional regulator
MTERTRPRAPRGEGAATRQELLNAAAALLDEHGDIDRISVNEIVRHVGVTPPVLYHHFNDKQALFAAVHAERAADLRKVLQTASKRGRNAIDSLERRGRAYIKWAVAHPDAYEALFLQRNSLGSAVFADRYGTEDSPFTDLADNVQACINEGSFVPGDVQLIARSIWSAVHGVAALAISIPDTFDPPGLDRVIATTIAMISAGFS